MLQKPKQKKGEQVDPVPCILSTEMCISVLLVPAECHWCLGSKTSRSAKVWQ